MQRFTSITTMAALVAGLFAPAMPMHHAGNGTRMVCHRATVAQAHHCAEMQNMDDAQPEPAPSSSSTFSSNETGNCPMDCCGCVQGNFGKNAAIVPMPTSFDMVVEQGRALTRSIVFRSRGLSSHTDRGPPSNHS